MTGLEGANVLLAIAGGLGVQGSDDLRAMAPIAGPMRDPGFRAAKAVGRSVRIVAFVPGIADRMSWPQILQVGNSSAPRQRS